MRILLNKYTLIGGLIIALLFGFYAFLLLNGMQFESSANSTPSAGLTVIAAASVPTKDMSLLSETATPTPMPETTDQNGFGIGKYVQISGTGGAGLRIREGAGTSYSVNFIANESEVFKVIGGPVTSDDITWYQLVAPYDDSRTGWASAEYLTIIEGQ